MTGASPLILFSGMIVVADRGTGKLSAEKLRAI
jgi:hypothetical protein